MEGSDRRRPPRRSASRRTSPPVDLLDDEYPIRLTTGRRLESYNTGAQTNLYNSPLHRGESIDLSPQDAASLAIADGELVRVSSRRGSVTAPARIDSGLRPGLAFMTFHFPDQVETNVLTIDATDPKSGTAEFKATAIRVEKLTDAAPSGNGAREHAAAPERRSSTRDGGRLMDLRLLVAVPSDAERAAVDGAVGSLSAKPRRRGAVNGAPRRRTSMDASRTADTTLVTSVTCCCRCCRQCRRGSDGSATAR